MQKLYVEFLEEYISLAVKRVFFLHLTEGSHLEDQEEIIRMLQYFRLCLLQFLEVR